jgi:two-component system, cell cycle sensor histidine kinase and response regulator CckA
MSKKSVRTLLVVEDNPGDARLLREMFRDDVSHNTELTQVQSMSEAEKLLAGRPFDIVLLDLGLPDAQGLGAVRRTHAAAPHVPLVVLTGTDDETLAVQALQEGAQDYLVKGQIEARGLLRALRYAIERKNMEEALFVEKERLRLQSAALEATAEGVMITARDGTITWVNPAFTRITGFRAEEALGRKPSILRSGKHDAALYGELWKTILDGRVWDGELTNMRRDGKLYLEAQTVTPVRDGRGAISHFVSVKRDVSNRRRFEDQLRQSQKMEAIGRLAGGVAHDFNNILGVIMGYGEILKRRIPAADPLQGKVDEILKAADSAAGLTRQLLAFSRKQVLQPRVLDLNLVVADMDKMLRRLIGEDIELKTSLREPLGSVQADPGQIEQVLMNLVVNARDAMPGAGSLLIETAAVDLDASSLALHPGALPGPHILLAVSDTGEGMDKETTSRIFEPFFTTKAVGKGTGLGLSTVYGIVEQSGGLVEVYSEKGVGTTFKVYLPRIEGTVARMPVEAAAPPPRAESKTVLLVEDETALRSMIEEILAEGGYRVLEASTPRRALDMAAAHDGPIHAVLTDVIMPGMSGRELAEKLALIRPDAPVIYMSGYTDDAIGHHGLLEPGTRFLQKPFTADAVLWTLHDALVAAERTHPPKHVPPDIEKVIEVA